MRKVICIVFALLFLFCSFDLTQAAKGAWFKNIGKYFDDIGKLGKKAKKVPAAQIEDAMKRVPALSRQSRDVARGFLVIERTVEKNTVAARLIEGGVNPARVAMAAEKYPQRVKLGNEIADLFAKNRPAANTAKLPPRAASAAKELDGNYAKTADTFFEMARRGGRKAVDIAEKLYEAATPGRVGAALAATLLAWHMLDPEGAETAVKDFFKEHVAPMVSAPVEGMVEGGSDTIDSVLDATGSQIRRIASNHWPWLLLILLSLAIWKLPNLRRLPFAIANSLFGSLANKFESSVDKKSARSGKDRITSSTHPSSKPKRVNIYGKK